MIPVKPEPETPTPNPIDPNAKAFTVQAVQSWWDEKVVVYVQRTDGADFIYNFTCSEEDAAKLVPGKKIRVSGEKKNGDSELEIWDATIELLDGMEDTSAGQVIFTGTAVVQFIGQR